MKKQLKVPKLRFMGFCEEWEEKKLIELSELITKGVTPSKFSKSGINFIKLECFEENYINEKKCLYIDKATHITSLKRSILLENDILFSITGSTIGKANIVDKKILPANINQALAIIRLKNKYLVKYILYTMRSKLMSIYIKSNIAYGSHHNLSLEHIKNFSFGLPSHLEQQKIVYFLSKIEEKLEKLIKRKELLEQYKIGIMQKIFSREIKFKDGNGKDFPEWEEKELSSLGNYFSGLSRKSSTDFGYGLPYITYKSIFDNIRVDLKKVGYVSVGKYENQAEVKKGDMFFTSSSEIPEEVGMNSVLMDEVTEKCFLNSFCFGFRFNSLDEILPLFMSYYFRSKKMRDKITSLAQGSTRYNLPKTKFLKILVSIPSLPEQQKIADFLSVLDKKIDIASQELAGVQEFKKGLLQQMFV